jgi:hypothetical protein
MMAGNLPVVPSRASLSASGRAAAPSTVRNGSEHFFGAAHNSASRQSFQAETASLRQNMAQNHVGAIPAGGREGAGESAARGRSARGGTSASASSSRSVRSAAEQRGGAGAASAANRDGFRPFTPPSHSDAARANLTHRLVDRADSGARRQRQLLEPDRAEFGGIARRRFVLDGYGRIVRARIVVPSAVGYAAAHCAQSVLWRFASKLRRIA